MALEQGFVRGVVLAPREITKSNFSRARCEERQVVQPDQVLKLLCEHSSRESVGLWATTCERVSGNLGLASMVIK